MAWHPDAIRKEIPPGSNDPRIIPVGCVLHVAVTDADSLFDFFDGPSGGIESTWYIRYDGTIEQYRDSLYEADANYRGNSWTSGGRRYGLHSIETAGFEHGEWTSAQIDAIKDLLVWDANEHGWPLRVAPDWTGPGVGYHVMWGAPGPWTPVAKSCPGPDRIDQFHDVIVPWINSGGNMALNSNQTSNAVWKGERSRPPRGHGGGSGDPDHWNHESVLVFGASEAEAAHDEIRKAMPYASPFLAGLREEEGKGTNRSLRHIAEWAERYAHGARSNAGQAVAIGRANAEQLALVTGELAGLREVIRQLAENAGTPIDMELLGDVVEQRSQAGASEALAALQASITLELEASAEPANEAEQG